jgi:polyisoprenoid-binding protein YceI
MQTERGLLAATLEPGRYDIDVSSSAVTFRTRHLFGLAPVRGAFALQSGTVDVAEPLADSGIQAGIESASFRTGNPQRDRSVRSARLLNSAQFPVITLGNGHVGADGRTVSGELTVRGVTRPVTFPVRLVAVSRESFTASAAIRLDRTEFGVTALRGLAGRYLDVAVEVRCVRK